MLCHEHFRIIRKITILELSQCNLNRKKNFTITWILLALDILLYIHKFYFYILYLNDFFVKQISIFLFN
jgi:hypothetical protein